MIDSFSALPILTLPTVTTAFGWLILQILKVWCEIP
jgi:hypothetical protein